MGISPWFVLILGMGTVFLGLFSIILLTKLMSRIIGQKNGKAPAAQPQKDNVPPVLEKAPESTVPVCPIEDRGCFSAVIAAAIAAYTGTEAEGLRIHSIRPVGAAPMPDADHGRFVAAIAAAVAETMGTDVSGLRIRSIKRIGGTPHSVMNGEHGRFVAAVSAAIAEATGTDASGLRIHSIKRV